MKLKLNLKLGSVGKFVKSDMSRLIFKSKLYAIAIWIVIFALEAILISGGLNDRGTTFIIVELIAIFVAMFIYATKISLSGKNLFISVAVVVLVYAILDFLIVNLILLKNDLSIYSFWPYYLKYIMIIIVPVIRSKKIKITVPNLKLPLTKKS